MCTCSGSALGRSTAEEVLLLEVMGLSRSGTRAVKQGLQNRMVSDFGIATKGKKVSWSFSGNSLFFFF